MTSTNEPIELALEYQDFTGKIEFAFSHAVFLPSVAKPD